MLKGASAGRDGALRAQAGCCCRTRCVGAGEQRPTFFAAMLKKGGNLNSASTAPISSGLNWRPGVLGRGGVGTGETGGRGWGEDCEWHSTRQHWAALDGKGQEHVGYAYAMVSTRVLT